jgi:uncharacterized SAM-binding protein YcdF (DUF218 family)
LQDLLFYSSKILKVLTLPEALLVLLLCLGALLLWSGRARTGRCLVTLAAVVFFVISFAPLGHWWMHILEERFPRPDLASLQPPDGIVVLGGSLSSLAATRNYNAIALNQRGERVVELAILARRFPKARLVHSGGTGDLRQENPPESEGLKPFAEALGIDPARLEFEERSRNTYENALYSRQQLQPKPGQRWLLVTSAAHMPRSVGVFREVGWQMIPYPVDFEAAEDPQWLNVDPVRNWYLLQTAMHESIGMIVYFLADYSHTLFPGPEAT